MDGSQAAECAIFCTLMGLWALYMLLYFSSQLGRLFPHSTKHSRIVDLWSTAMATRETWARDLMGKAEDARGAALLAVQQMRNIIVSSTLLVMGIAQVAGRLLQLMTNEANLSTIAALARKDPMTGPGDSWAPPEVRVSVPFGACLLSLLCFGQTVRAAVHVGFNIRVQAMVAGKSFDGEGDGTQGVLLSDEVVAILKRCEIYFTLGLRCMYLFIGTVFWTLGTTPLLVSSVTVLILLFLSDILVVPLPDRRRPGRRPAPPPPQQQMAVAAHPASPGTVLPL